MSTTKLPLASTLCLPLLFALACNDDASADDEVGDTGTDTGDTDTTGTTTGDGDTGTSSSTDTDTGTDTDTDTGTDTTGDGDIEINCSVDPGDHSELCEGPDCAVLTDVVIRCDDTEFSDPGLRVAPIPSGAALVTSSTNAGYLFEASGEAGEWIDTLPDSVDRQSLLLAQDLDGSIRLMGDLTTFGGGGEYPGGLTYLEPMADAWVEELVFDNDKYIRPTDFEIDLDGTAHTWFEDDPSVSYEHAWRNGPDDWSLEDAPPINVGAWPRYVIGAGGEHVSMSFIEVNNAWQLMTRTDGQDAPLGSLVEGWFPDRYMPVDPPMPSFGGTGPAYAALLLHPSGLRVAWPNGGGFDEVELPGTGIAEWTCTGGNPLMGCDALPCQETAVGIAGETFNVARTADGVAWVVWVETQFDVTLAFTQECANDEECWCAPQVVADQSTATLRVVRLDFAGPAEEVLSLDVDPPQLNGVFSGPPDIFWAVDARAFEQRLAVGLRLRETDGDAFSLERKLRLLEIDTELLP